jgi:predicted transport protein
MKLYSLKNEKVNQIQPISFKLEKDIQNVVENNLREIFDLELIRSEVSVRSFRIDTLCFDPENKCFVIIEYKKDRNFSIIDQGYTYMSLILNNKADFILEYNENNKKSLRKDDVDWSQSRVIFISPNFTEYQKHSVNFKDVPFELWEIARYDNHLIGFTQHKPTSKESISDTNSSPTSLVKSISDEVKVYSEDFHINQPKVSASTKELYQTLKERVLGLGNDIEVVPRKMYIGFKRGKNFFDVSLLKGALWCWINVKKGELDDPKKLCRDVTKIGHYGNGDYDLSIDPDTDLDYVMFLIKQSYKKRLK